MLGEILRNQTQGTSYTLSPEAAEWPPTSSFQSTGQQLFNVRAEGGLGGMKRPPEKEPAGCFGERRRRKRCSCVPRDLQTVRSNPEVFPVRGHPDPLMADKSVQKCCQIAGSTGAAEWQRRGQLFMCVSPCAGYPNLLLEEVEGEKVGCLEPNRKQEPWDSRAALVRPVYSEPACTPSRGRCSEEPVSLAGTSWPLGGAPGLSGALR